VSDRILALGLDAEHERIDRVEFDAEASLVDYATVVIDPRAVPALWERFAQGRDGRLVTKIESDGGFGTRLLELFRRRRREVGDVLRGGGTVVCLLRPVGRPLHVVRPGPRTTTTILHAYTWLPNEPSLAQLVIAAPESREMRAVDEDHAVWQLIEAQGEVASFEVCAGNEPTPAEWHAIAVDAEGRPVAFEVSVGSGRLLFLPPIAARDPRERGVLVERFLAPPAATFEPTPVPEWIADHLLPGQGELAARLAELGEQAARLEAERAETRARHDDLAEFAKLLYARTGSEMLEAAASAFRLFGFGVELAEPDLLSLRCDEGDVLAVVAAGEGAIDSDPYWALMRHMEGRSDEPKSLIIGNACCADPPGRREAPFSDLLVRGAQHRAVCLLSTVELHAAVAAVLASPDDEDLRLAIRHAVVEVTGPCILLPL